MSDNIPRFNAQDFYTVETSPSVIKEELRTALYNYLGYTPTDSDPRMLEAMALMPYIVQTRALADAAAKSALLTYAQGEALDRIADSTCVYGYMDRLPARRAVMWVRLDLEVGTVGTAHYSGTFTAHGITFSGEGDYQQTFLAEANGRYYVPFFAEETGTQANGIDSTVDTDLAANISSGVSVDYTGGTASAGIATVYRSGNYVTEIPSCGGRDEETDAEFAARIAEQMHALRVPGSKEYYNFTARQVDGISDVYTSEALDNSGRVQSWYSSPYVYAICDTIQGPTYNFICYCADSTDDYFARFYGGYRDAMASAKLAGVGLIVGPAFHSCSGLSTSIELTVYQGLTQDEENTIISELYRRLVAKYNEKMGLTMTATEISMWAQELGAVSAQTTFINSATDIYQAPANCVVPLLPLNITITSRIPRETSPFDTGGTGEEVL
jgi:phage-related baseplate assembly protein